jgi:hypothetical protein
VALAARIQGHVRAASFLLDSNGVDEEDVHKVVGAEVLPATLDTLQHLTNYQTEYRSVLPLGVVQSIDGLLSRHSALFAKAPSVGGPSSAAQNIRHLRAAAAILESHRVEIDHFISGDQDPVYAAHVERALLHLQRQLDIDGDVFRPSWQKAFDQQTEPALERLGGVHLLSHGLFGFKADAGGGRTDLILGTSPDPIILERAATPLVLTEWKKIDGANLEHDLAKKTSEARRQLGRYKGALSGLELHSVCFGVMVSRPNLAMPPDETLPSGLRIRWVNVAVAPAQPSNPSVPLK